MYKLTVEIRGSALTGHFTLPSAIELMQGATVTVSIDTGFGRPNIYTGKVIHCVKA